MTQNIEINQNQISNQQLSKKISLSENNQHDPFHLESKSIFTPKTISIQTETEGQEAMLKEKNSNQFHPTSNRYQFDQSGNNLRQTPKAPKIMSLMTDTPYLKNELVEIQEKLPNSNTNQEDNNNNNANNEFLFNHCLNSINLFLTPFKKKIIFIVLIIVSCIMFIQSIFEIPFQYQLMNQLWYFILEMIDGLLLELFFGLFILSKQSSKVLIVNNGVVLILLISQIVFFAIKNYSLLSLIANLLYALFMSSGYFFSIILINTTLKSQKNLMQNIEEIINFTEIVEEPKLENKIKGQ